MTSYHHVSSFLPSSLLLPLPGSSQTLSPSAGLCVEWILLPMLGLHSPGQDPGQPALAVCWQRVTLHSFALKDTMWP